MPSNAEIAAAFTELADRMAVTESKPFRLMAYRKAADLFVSLPDSVEVLAREGTLKDLPGIGPAIVEKVDALIERGSFDALDRARADVPDGLLRLTKVSGVGVKTAVKVWNGIDATSFADVVGAARSGDLAQVPGVGAKVVDAVLAAADLDEQGGDAHALHFLRSDVDLVIGTVREHLLASNPGAEVLVAGDFARGADMPTGACVVVHVEALDLATFLAAVEARGWSAMTADAKLPGVADHHVAYTPVVAPSGMPVDVWWSLPEALPAVLLTATGPIEHVTDVLDRIAPDTEVSAAVSGRPRVSVREVERPDDSIYAAAGLQVVPPELRDRPDAIERAAAAALPQLVREEELTSELHCHSTWSDGKASILEMAVAALERGDTFLAMTDHSAPYAMVGGLGDDRLRLQAEEIAKVNAELGGEFTVLRGSEVEIGGDGTLGLPDDVLARLDWAVASIHVSQKQDAETINRRMEIAMRNPLIDVIGHPTSRRLLRRGPTKISVERLIELALETGTMLEINANPERLDLDAAHARMALEAGVLLTIDSDAHRTTTLALRTHGVAVARAAGATAVRVANTFSLDELRAVQPRNRA